MLIYNNIDTHSHTDRCRISEVYNIYKSSQATFVLAFVK